MAKKKNFIIDDAEEITLATVNQAYGTQSVDDTASPVRTEAGKRFNIYCTNVTAYNDLSKIAYVNRDTISRIMTRLIEQYVADHQSELAEYESIKKA